MNNLTLLSYLKKFGTEFVIIILCALLGGGYMAYSAKKQKVTTYSASRDVVISHNPVAKVNSSQGDNNSIVNNDISMMPTYKEIVENDLIAKGALKKLPKNVRSKYTVSDIQGAVSAKVSQQSLVLKIKATTSSEKDSVLIVNAVSKVFKEKLSSLQPGAGQVTMLAEANKDNVTSSTHPSLKKRAIVGVALGGLFGLIITLVIATIKNFL